MMPIEIPTFMYHGHDDNVFTVAWSPDSTSVAWSPDGAYVASGDTGGIIQVWEANTGRNIVSYHGHTRFVRSIAWSPDSSHIASGADFGDNTAQIWAAFSGNRVYTHKQQYRIFGVAWSPDGKRIASGSFDGSVQTWDAFTGSDNVNYRDHSNPIYATTWSPNG